MEHDPVIHAISGDCSRYCEWDESNQRAEFEVWVNDEKKTTSKTMTRAEFLDEAEKFIGA